MTRFELLALMPVITLTVTAVVQMLLLCVLRNHLLMLLVTLIGLFSTFWNIGISSDIVAINGGVVPVTILLSIDNYFVFFAKLIVIASAVCVLQTFQYFRHSKPAAHFVEEFYILLVLACLGALVLVAAQHFIGFFLGLEIMGISLFAMIAYPVGSFRALRSGIASRVSDDAESSMINTRMVNSAIVSSSRVGRETVGKANSAVRHSLEAAFKYLVLSSIASSFLLLGMAFIYAQTGSMSYMELQNYFELHYTYVQGQYSQGQDFQGQSGMLMQLALVLLLIGIAFKLSLVPFHLWTPDVYQGAPTPVTAFIATVSKGAVVAALMRYFIVTDAYRYDAVISVLSLLAIATMLVGNLLALTQHNIKRILAYSSIAHIGYLFVAFLAVAKLEDGDSTIARLSVEAVAFYIAAYFVTTLGAFAVVSAVSEQGLLTEEPYNLRFYRGLFWRQPWVASCFILMLLSLAGIPLTMGFIGKFYIFAAGAQSELWGLLLAVVVGSAIGLYYYLRIIIVMMQRETAAQQAHRPLHYSGWMENAIIFSLTGLLLLFGVYPAPLISWLDVL
ncbi:MAG: NADH-quinone oxidoreductase subunit N [Pseudomonadales bacterium]